MWIYKNHTGKKRVCSRGVVWRKKERKREREKKDPCNLHHDWCDDRDAEQHAPAPDVEGTPVKAVLKSHHRGQAIAAWEPDAPPTYHLRKTPTAQASEHIIADREHNLCPLQNIHNVERQTHPYQLILIDIKQPIATVRQPMRRETKTQTNRKRLDT